MLALLPSVARRSRHVLALLSTLCLFDADLEQAEAADLNGALPAHLSVASIKLRISRTATDSVARSKAPAARASASTCSVRPTGPVFRVSQASTRPVTPSSLVVR